MKKITKLQLYSVALTSTIFIALGQLLFAQAHQAQGILIGPVLINGFFVGGLFAYLLGAILFLLALRYGKVSDVHPINALAFVWVALGGWLFLQQQLSITELAGVFSIGLGVVLVTRG
jgi:drug/metabolite transporter (DMT)-like permease